MPPDFIEGLFFYAQAETLVRRRYTNTKLIWFSKKNIVLKGLVWHGFGFLLHMFQRPLNMQGTKPKTPFQNE